MTTTSWDELRQGRAEEQGSRTRYSAARLAYDLGCQIRELRESRGWTQRELASRAQMTQSAIARLEAGGTIPTLPVLERVAEAFGSRLQIELAPANT